MQGREETIKSAITIGKGGYAVNYGHLVIDKPLGNAADITEQAIAAGRVLEGRNIALYGMAALTDNPDNEGQQKLADNATMINKGTIEIHLKDMVEAYKSQVKLNTEDKDGTYRFVKCFAIAAGKNSMIVNDGVIRVYFDHYIESQTPVYGESMVAGENSTIVNNGTIELLGNGSFATQARAIAVPANSMTIVNNGKIKVDMERASTVRVLATTGQNGALLNYGSIDVSSTGRIMTMARLANTYILNEGSINVVSKATFIVNKVSFLYQSYPLACAFYEHCLPNTSPMPPIVNHGTVKVHLEGSEASTPQAVAFGMYSEMAGKEEQTHRFENTGSIKVTKSGPYDFQTAELGVNIQAKKDFNYNIEIGEWHTDYRDFRQTRDLFLCSSGIFDLSNAHIEISDAPEGKNVAADDLISQTAEGRERGDRFEYKV